MDFRSVPVIWGIATVPTWQLVVAISLANLLRALARRPHPSQMAFNVANEQLALVAAVVTFQAFLRGSSPVRPLGWLALAAAVAAYEVATALGVFVIMSVAGGRPGRAYLSGLAVPLSLIVPITWTLAVVALTAYWTNHWTVLVLGGCVLAVALLYRSAYRLRERFSDLQSLYGFNMHLGELTEVSEIVTAGLLDARSILRCEHVELCVRRSRRGYRYRIDATEGLVRESAELSDLERAVMSSRNPELIPHGHGHPDLETRGFSDLMAVPVTMEGGDTAVLVAADRQGDGSGTFDADDLKLLQALAAHLGTAMTSSGRLDQLRTEVAAREHEAYHDSLTGLANRALFSQVVTGALKNRKPSRLVGVMIMDLDGFKEINDTLGHHTGDAILKEIAGRVNDAVGAKRMAARLGGDEFAFLVPAATDIDEISAIAAGILQKLSEPVSVGGMVLAVRASIGVATAPLHGSDTSSLLRRADVAMYAAKRSSKGVFVYDPRTDHHSTRRLVVASELQHAVENDGLELFFQPVAELAGGRITGVEGLLRWQNPELGAVSPNEFIPVAEQTGLIEPLTWWVLRTALHELRRWRDNGYEIDMAVNVSARSLFDTVIVARLRQMLQELEVSPRHLILEITESSMMLDQSRSERILRELSDLGVSLAIDDFGTGYSSLSRLKELPVNVVKIDRSFVKNMSVDKGDQAIVRSTIELARVMGHSVVAEGVEDRETWNQLVEFGCTHAQGYYLARPMPASEFDRWIASHQSPTLAPVRRILPRAATGT